ncbi:hypothetical protein BD413DRAFT_164667 [Trametes elegans]|nr:hypothetical protein BD413DRAFT_164667 [Trametes elegans]
MPERYLRRSSQFSALSLSKGPRLQHGRMSDCRSVVRSPLPQACARRARAAVDSRAALLRTLAATGSGPYVIAVIGTTRPSPPLAEVRPRRPLLPVTVPNSRARFAFSPTGHAPLLYFTTSTHHTSVGAPTEAMPRGPDMFRQLRHTPPLYLTVPPA